MTLSPSRREARQRLLNELTPPRALPIEPAQTQRALTAILRARLEGEPDSDT